MGLALTVLLWTLLAVALVCLAAIILPVRFDLHLNAEPQVHYGIVARPFLGYAPGLPLLDSARPRKKPAPKRKRRRARKSTRERTRRARLIAKAAPDLLRGLLGAVRLEAVRLDGAFGAADPADTGHVFGLLCPLIYALPGSERCHVRLRPDFDRPLLEGRFEARVRVVPIWIAGTVLRFGWRVFGPGR